MKIKKYKLLLSLAVMLLPILIFPVYKSQTAFAESRTVVVPNLNVREAADMSSNVIDMVHIGDTFDVIQTRSSWDQIKLLNNKMGWVYHNYLTPTQSIEATVAAKVLNIREKPSLSSRVVGKLKWGTKITVHLEKAGWAKMVSPSGTVGWVYERYITKTAPQTNSETVPQTQTQTQLQAQSQTPVTEVAPAPPVQNSQGSLTGKTIVLDPGHGGIDPGTKSVLGTPEKTLTLDIAKAVEQKLVDSGAKVIMTRTDDSYISLPQRAAISNRSGADAFISFHFNWSEDPAVSGMTGFYFQKTRDHTLASDLLNEIVKSTNLQNIGARFNNLSVLRNNSQPSTLIELGFVSNQQDDAVVESATYRNNVAEGVYQGLAAYFSGK